MHIRELVARTGSSERQVRYLIAEGFISPPTGGRAMADYGETHVEAVQRYMHLRELGFPPAAIRKLLEAKEGAPFPVAPGITLVVDPTSCTAARTSRRCNHWQKVKTANWKAANADLRERFKLNRRTPS